MPDARRILRGPAAATAPPPGSEEQAAAPGAQRVGAALRQAREERGLSLDEVGNAIRFPARMVLAVEEGRLGELPPHPFARGLVVAYASHLGLDAARAAREWGRPGGEGDAGRRSLFRVPVRPRSSWRDWAVPGACAIAAALSMVVGTAINPPPVVAPDGGIPRAAPASPPDAPAEPEAVVPAAPEAGPEAGGVVVTLRSEAATWVEVAADDEAPRRQELPPGGILHLGAGRRLGLTLGDAGTVRVTVNGRELGFIGDPGEVRRGIVFEAPSPSARRGGGAP